MKSPLDHQTFLSVSTKYAEVVKFPISQNGTINMNTNQKQQLNTARENDEGESKTNTLNHKKKSFTN